MSGKRIPADTIPKLVIKVKKSKVSFDGDLAVVEVSIADLHSAEWRVDAGEL